MQTSFNTSSTNMHYKHHTIQNTTNTIQTSYNTKYHQHNTNIIQYKIPPTQYKHHTVQNTTNTIQTAYNTKYHQHNTNIIQYKIPCNTSFTHLQNYRRRRRSWATCNQVWHQWEPCHKTASSTEESYHYQHSEASVAIAVGVVAAARAAEVCRSSSNELLLLVRRCSSWESCSCWDFRWWRKACWGHWWSLWRWRSCSCPVGRRAGSFLLRSSCRLTDGMSGGYNIKVYIILIMLRYNIKGYIIILLASVEMNNSILHLFFYNL